MDNKQQVEWLTVLVKDLIWTIQVPRELNREVT